MDIDIEKKIELFFRQFKFIHFKEGDNLFAAQDTPPGIYYLKTGYVRQFIISEEGKELTIHLYGPGSYFPMMWALSDISNCYNYQTLTETDAFLASKQKVVDFLRNEPLIAFEFSKKMLHGLNGLSIRIESIVFGHAYHRVISVLIYLANHFGEKDGLKIKIKHKFTHQDIASLVGITREHVSIEMEKLEKDRLIEDQSHNITILNINKLNQKLKKIL